ncbi:adenylate/guanylate cyclase domain-containing protein [Segnochrobactraceae bacterium EtOH-i3]
MALWTERQELRWRLGSGLVLALFVATHLLNHAVGIWSLAAMEAVQGLRVTVWRSPPGTLLLYGALVVHVVLGLKRTLSRRTVRMPLRERVQMVLGLLIPLLLARHVIGTRGLHDWFGVPDDYANALVRMWPDGAIYQMLLLIIAWTHGMLGIRFWLRGRHPELWQRIAPVALSVAVALPLLASWGWIGAARIADAGGARPPVVSARASDWFSSRVDGVVTLWVLVLVVLVILGLARSIAASGGFGRNAVTVIFPGNHRVRSAPGATVLEIARMGGIPLASVCGGRARCSTCRVRLVSGADCVAPPESAEAAVLARVGAEPGIRLACQIRPTGNVEVQPLFPVMRARGGPETGDAYDWGVERTVTILFVDMRGFTRLSEKRLPFDVVYVLNRYLAAMADAIRAEGGHVDKFIGDAVMAIFGLTDGPGRGAQAALAAARRMVVAVDEINATLGHDIGQTLRIGIGIHTGPAILGRVGVARTGPVDDGANRAITALGDTVNTAARLESLSKDYGATVVLSEATAAAAGLVLDPERRRLAEIRGRRALLAVFALTESEAIFALPAKGPSESA